MGFPPTLGGGNKSTKKKVEKNTERLGPERKKMPCENRKKGYTGLTECPA